MLFVFYLFFFFYVPNLFPFCSIFNCSRPCLWISVSQTPLQFSRCYDKPWLVNSKAVTPVRDSHCPDLQLPSPEVEYGFAD
uniref:Secreted protein n=2 Tax=Sus scrofa TaxID=9823 RepID=A0A8D1X7Q6_PIG